MVLQMEDEGVAVPGQVVLLAEASHRTAERIDSGRRERPECGERANGVLGVLVAQLAVVGKNRCYAFFLEH